MLGLTNTLFTWKQQVGIMKKTLSIIAVVKINCYKQNYHHNNYYMYCNS